MNYTKGPWKIYEEGDGKNSFVDGNGEIVESVAIIPHDDITEEGLEEVKGNIALITHADQMYELLDEIRPILGYLRDKYGSAEALTYLMSVEKLLKEIENG